MTSTNRTESASFAGKSQPSLVRESLLGPPWEMEALGLGLLFFDTTGMREDFLLIQMVFKERSQLRQGIAWSVLNNLIHGLTSFKNVHSWFLYFLNYFFFLAVVNPNLNASMACKCGHPSL